MQPLCSRNTVRSKWLNVGVMMFDGKLTSSQWRLNVRRTKQWFSLDHLVLHVKRVTRGFRRQWPIRECSRALDGKRMIFGGFEMIVES